MDETAVMEMGELLKRRVSQRQYLKQQLENVKACQAKADTHVEAINEINRRLVKLGYTGL